jgi:hypothetical protein
MAQTTVTIRTLHGATAAVGWSNGRSVAIDRSEPLADSASVSTAVNFCSLPWEGAIVTISFAKPPR